LFGVRGEKTMGGLTDGGEDGLPALGVRVGRNRAQDSLGTTLRSRTARLKPGSPAFSSGTSRNVLPLVL